MKFFLSSRLFIAFFAVMFVLVNSSGAALMAQSKPQKTEKPTGDGKKNERPKPLTEEEKKKLEEEKRLLEEEKNAIFIDDIEKVESKIVNVDAVVYNKKSGQIMVGLKKGNFAIFENGVKQEITSFAEPESPITVSLVVEYSKWSELFGSAAGGYFEPGANEVIKPVAYFLSRFIKPPNDYASVIAFDLRPTPITDFTNDPKRLNDTVNLLFRNRPAFRENNLFDAIKFALIGGRGDSVVLENSQNEKSDYLGMVAVKSKRRAIILVASGIDTFSKINYDQARRIIQEAGVPIYIISTGNLFYKKYEHLMPATDGLTGMPGRMSFLQAQNVMNTIAKESGGAHFPMTFEGEIPGYLNSINGMLRSQYSLSYDLGETKREPGKKNKLEVRVDLDGDGQFDDKTLIVQHRPFYTTPKPLEVKKK
ncbi:MAG: VWA domain-containing protein [Pyrinomonadaceae bacterium]|nr:VWA domain-containing protein [Acidobacteriota bacterium]MBP7474901.1 VWA domain-containing protein [Pyrinomonadaceae bacterium]MBP9110227.1 VWA domain-containing protein [Pyrinomonadaceae bacterium]